MSARAIDPGRLAYLAVNTAVVVFLLLPLVIVGVFALNPTPYIAFPPVGVTLRWFAKFFASADFMNALWLSLRVAAVVVVASTVIGALAALAIARGNLPGARILTALFLSPLMLPAILTGLALFQVFMLAGIGRPVWGLVVGHTLVAVPYVLRTTLSPCPTCCVRLSRCCMTSTGASRRRPPCWARRPRACSARSPCR